MTLGGGDAGWLVAFSSRSELLHPSPVVKSIRRIARTRQRIFREEYLNMVVYVKLFGCQVEVNAILLL